MCIRDRCCYQDQPCGDIVEAGSDSATSEEKYSQERGLQEEGEDAFSGQRRSEHIAHESGILSPIRAKGELHGYPRGHSNGESGGEEPDPEIRSFPVLVLSLIHISEAT